MLLLACLVVNGLEKLDLFFQRLPSVLSINVSKGLLVQVLNQQHRSHHRVNNLCKSTVAQIRL